MPWLRKPESGRYRLRLRIDTGCVMMNSYLRTRYPQVEFGPLSVVQFLDSRVKSLVQEAGVVTLNILVLAVVLV